MRKYEFILSMRPRDIHCWSVHGTFGRNPPTIVLDLNFLRVRVIAKKKKLQKEKLGMIMKAEKSEHLELNRKEVGFCFFLLGEAFTDSDLIYVYGYPAQIMRVVQDIIQIYLWNRHPL